MKLYFHPGTCSLASHISLREAAIPFETAEVDLRTKQVDGVDFQLINPKGCVPALQLDDGQVLTENAAVLQYIADLKPAADLAPPAGTMARYRLQEWLGFINSELHKSFAPFFSVDAGDDAKTHARNHLNRRLNDLHRALGEQAYLLDNHFTVADAYLFTVLSWGSLVGVDIGQWPNLQNYMQRMGARPAVIEAMTAEGLIRN